MNLFRSEDHLQQWPLHIGEAVDYVLPIADRAEVFSASGISTLLRSDSAGFETVPDSDASAGNACFSVARGVPSRTKRVREMTSQQTEDVESPHARPRSAPQGVATACSM